jgi:two-component system sensor kinase FixL
VDERTLSLKKTVQALQRAKEEVSTSLEKEKELNQLKSRFVSMASHEFRTPLSAIQLSASLIDKYAQPFKNEHISKHVAKIKNSVGNLTAILNDFLSLEKLEAGKIEPTFIPFDLVKFSEEITEEMQLVAKQNQKIIYQHTGKINTISLDQNLLKNCIINLMTNAIKYSGENTFIEFNTETTENTCVITIQDNGIGIPDADQKHLFEPFFRAHNTGNIAGTGLGLNIVARYTHLMKGKIDFKSVVNQGTLFTISFITS